MRIFIFLEIKSFRRPYRVPFRCMLSAYCMRVLSINIGPGKMAGHRCWFHQHHSGTIRTIENHSLCGSDRMFSRLQSHRFQTWNKETTNKLQSKYPLQTTTAFDYPFGTLISTSRIAIAAWTFKLSQQNWHENSFRFSHHPTIRPSDHPSGKCSTSVENIFAILRDMAWRRRTDIKEIYCLI